MERADWWTTTEYRICLKLHISELLTYSEMCESEAKETYSQIVNLHTYIIEYFSWNLKKKKLEAVKNSTFNLETEFQEQRAENKFDLDKNVRVKIIYPSDVLIRISQFAKRHRNLRITREIGSNQTGANQTWLILTNQLDKIH